jgi:fatty-acid peroxygenase
MTCPHAVRHDTGVPSMHTLDDGLALLREGYRYAPSRRQRSGSDAYRTRLGGRRCLVLGGSVEAVRLFYDESRMQRRGAVPGPVRRTLFGRGAVHGLDGQQHDRRKEMFLDLLTPAAAVDIAAGARHRWEGVLSAGPVAELRLFDAAVDVHAGAICDWAGIPPDARYPRLATDLARIVDGFGSFGRRHVRAVVARRRANHWARGLVAAVRSGAIRAPDGSALAVVSRHRDGAELLPEQVAGVELLNILRPTVAVAWLVAFAALVLHEHPELTGIVRSADDATLESFAHEVRRLCPFVPVLGARARQGFEWRGERVRRRQRILLDVYGTLHDPTLWSEPERFDLHRFLGRQPDPYTLIPQGGGPKDGHRCPGERIAVELVKTATRWLSTVSYDVGQQDLRVPLDRLPTRPRSGLVLTAVRPPNPARSLD